MTDSGASLAQDTQMGKELRNENSEGQGGVEISRNIVCGLVLSASHKRP